MAGRGKRGQDLKQQFWSEFRAAAAKNRMWCKTKGFTAYLAQLQREYPMEMFKMYLDSMPKDIVQEHDGEVVVRWETSLSPIPHDPSNLRLTNKPSINGSLSKSATDAGAKPSKRSTTSSTK